MKYIIFLFIFTMIESDFSHREEEAEGEL